MKVKDIIVRAAARYNDAEYVRVSQDMYLMFLDSALNQLILARPDAHVKTDNVQLVAGTRQSLPTDGYRLIDIPRNMIQNADESFSPGAPIRQVSKDTLDAFSDWHDVASATEVQEFMYDIKNPRVFWVSQSLSDTVNVFVEMDYSYAVDSYSNMSGTFAEILELDLPIDGVFLEPLVTYMLYLLFSVDSSATGDMQIAHNYRQIFFQLLGLEYKAATLESPKVREMTNASSE